jgi:L-amino acid N-acyltransferase YncA
MKLFLAVYPQAVAARQYSVRPARADDAAAISAIYNEEIADRATRGIGSSLPRTTVWSSAGRLDGRWVDVVLMERLP